MAVFNPQINPTNDPNYLGYSKPITQPEADRSKEFLFRGLGEAAKGIGNVVELGAKGMDYLVKNEISTELYNSVDSERTAYGAALEHVRDSSVGDLRGPSAPGAALPYAEEQAPMPAELETVGSTVSTLDAAYGAGKISQTHYYGRLNTIAKSLRAKYPGYRDYIDTQIAQVTGVNPANAYLNSMIQDINRSMTTQQSEQNKVMADIKKNLDLPDATDYLEGYASGRRSASEVYQWLHGHLREKNELERRKAIREDFKGSRELERESAVDDTSYMVGLRVNRYFESMKSKGGLTPEKIEQALAMHRSGEKVLSAEQAVQLSQQIRQFRDVAFKEVWKDITMPDKTGKTILSRIGTGSKATEEAKKLIDNHLVIFDTVANAISKNDIDVANTSMEMAKAIASDSKLNILNDKTLGGWARTISAAEAVGGQYAVQKVIQATEGNGNFNREFKAYVNQTVGGFVGQPDIRQGEVKTLKGAVDDAFNKMKANPTQARQFNHSINSFINSISLIADPNSSDQVKENLIRSAFDPANRGLIAKFNFDDLDPNTGKRIPGRYSVFTRLTHPDITQEVLRLGKKNPELWKNYVNWAEETFANDLFSREVNDLKTIQSNPMVQMTWDSDNNRFGFKVGKDSQAHLKPIDQIVTANPTLMRTYPRAQLEKIQKTINRLNSGLQSMSNIAATAPNGNVGNYLLDLMGQMGFDPASGQGVGGIPEEMYKILVRTKKPTFEQRFIGKP